MMDGLKHIVQLFH